MRGTSKELLRMKGLNTGEAECRKKTRADELTGYRFRKRRQGRRGREEVAQRARENKLGNRK